MTALMWAAFHGKPSHIKMLLENGADPSLKDVDGMTAAHWSIQRHDTRALQVSKANKTKCLKCAVFKLFCSLSPSLPPSLSLSLSLPPSLPPHLPPSLPPSPPLCVRCSSTEGVQSSPQTKERLLCTKQLNRQVAIVTVRLSYIFQAMSC